MFGDSVSNSIDSETTRLVKGTFYTFSSFVLVKLIMAVNSVVVARMLTPNNLGILTMLEQIHRVVLVFATVGIPLALVKYISELAVEESADIKKYFSSALIIVIVCAFVFCTAYALLNNQISEFYQESILAKLIIFSAATTFFYSLWETVGAVLRGFHRIKTLSTLNVVRWLVIVPVNILLIKLLGLIGAVQALMMCSSINLLLMIIVVGRESRRYGFPLSIKFFDLKTMKKLFGYGLPATISAILVSFPMWVAISHLSKQADFASVGLYRVSYSLMMIIMFIPMALAVPIVPLFSELEKKNPVRMEKFFHQSIRLTARIMVPVTVGLALFSKYLIPLLYGSNYYSAWSVLFFLCAGVYFLSLSSIVGYLIAGTGKMWQGSLLNLIWAALFIVFSIVLINKFGLIGFGLAYLLSYIIHTFTSFVYLKISFRIHVANIKNILFAVFVAYCITYFLLNTTWFNETLIFVISVVLWICILVLFYYSLSKREKHLILSLLKAYPLKQTGRRNNN